LIPKSRRQDMYAQLTVHSSFIALGGGECGRIVQQDKSDNDDDKKLPSPRPTADSQASMLGWWMLCAHRLSNHDTSCSCRCRGSELESLYKLPLQQAHVSVSSGVGRTIQTGRKTATPPTPHPSLSLASLQRLTSAGDTNALFRQRDLSLQRAHVFGQGAYPLSCRHEVPLHRAAVRFIGRAVLDARHLSTPTNLMHRTCARQPYERSTERWVLQP
jgi:hypothetical protein